MEFQQPGLNAAGFLDELYRHEGMAYPKFHKMDHLCKLGILATEILLKNSGHPQKYRDDETGVVLSNRHGSLDVDLKYAKTMKTGASPALFVYTLPNIVIGEIAIRHKFKGENAFFVFKSFNGNFIAGYVNGLFESRLIQCCICGWVDFLGEEYHAMLMLVETTHSGTDIPFTVANINQLNNANHE
ncbi:MAG: beta-ketoacyl synthase N-terminal-like domain-containing protein [Bacteroidota bacterium]|nr:beta-ketoacyl synthase N-terminal-like domain-containing protein [Bacteroidota bacterium]MDP4251415.1 beta-ketoacyl synthase N-terminal-like domain-containing protein [Bacteroidota bacterium]